MRYLILGTLALVGVVCNFQFVGKGFSGCWGLSFVVLLFIFMLVGWIANGKWWGILVDNRKRCSLTHFQIVVWTLVILSSMGGVLIANDFDWAAVNPTPELLGLMGISASSAVLATGVKSSKDARSSVNVIRGELTTNETTKNNKKKTVKNLTGANFAQLWLEEEGDPPPTVNITKFQNFIFTLVSVMFYVSLALKADGLPVLPENVVWLIGISHGGYVGGKIPDKK